MTTGKTRRLRSASMSVAVQISEYVTSEGGCTIRRGSRSSMGSSFYRQDAAYWKRTISDL